MPAFSGPFGPIVEPGWPSTLPGSPDIAGTLQSAIQMKMNMDIKQQRLEQELQNYSLRQQKMDQDRDLAGQRFQLAHDAQEYRHQKDRDDDEYKYKALESLDNHRVRMGEIRDAEQNLKEDKWNSLSKGSLYLRQVEAQLNAENLKVGEPGYDKRRSELLATIPDDARYPSSELNAANRLVKQNSNRVNFDKQREYDMKVERWKKDMGRTVWGTEQLTDPWPVFYPDQLTPEKKGGGWTLHGKEEGKPTGKLIVKSWNADGAYDRPVDPGELRRLRREWRELEKEGTNILPQQSDSTLGVNEIEQMPKDPKDLRINHVYMGPKGPGTWTGTGFIPYQ